MGLYVVTAVAVLLLAVAQGSLFENAEEPMDITRLQPIPEPPVLPVKTEEEGTDLEEEDDGLPRFPTYEKASVKLTGGYQQFTLQTLADCGEAKMNLTEGDFGVLTTPNHPKNYPSNKNCLWTLESEPGTKIRGVLFDVITQGWFLNYWDFLMISKSGDFESFDRYTGDYNSKTPFTVESETNKLLIRFRSSFLFNFRGFKMHYMVVRDNTTLQDSGRYTGLENCGVASPMYVNKADGVKIVGGGEVPKHSFPWMAFLQIDKKYVCGSSIITKKHLLTAAHCTDGAKNIDILLGGHSLKDKEEKRVVIKATKYTMHPNYNRNTVQNDISIIELPEEIEFTDTIRPICLPSLKETPEFHFGEDFRLTGWGKTADGSGVSPVLKTVNLTITMNDKCAQQFGSLVTGNLICAGTKKGESACQGDSGGPLQYVTCDGIHVQQGIVSFGGRSCEQGYPNGFTRVTAYLPFIAEVTGMKF